jgi:hypothetical protein
MTRRRFKRPFGFYDTHDYRAFWPIVLGIGLILLLYALRFAIHE